MNIEKTLQAFTALGATWILWLLVFLSVAGIAVIVERALYLWSSRDDVPRLAQELRELLSRGDAVRARHRLEESPSFEARIAAAALGADGVAGAEQRMLAEGELARLRMEQRLAFLGTLGNNAPFVGLLGTVIGIIRAFRALEAGAGQVSSSLMAEIGEALAATAVGLLVALPAVAAFNAFQRVIRTRLGRGQVLARVVLAHFEKPAPVAGQEGRSWTLG
jgi:biopolymer transport protein ExbB